MQRNPCGPITSAAWLFVLLSLMSGVAPRAVTVTTLYEATVPVADASDAARRRATEQALRIVLVKLTGNARAPVLPGAGGILERGESLVEQYQILKSRGPDGEPELRLEVLFGREALDAVLVEAGLSRWSNERPETLLWLFVSREGEWVPVAPGIGDDWVATLAQVVTGRARDRGLPLAFPEYDMRDVEALQTGSFDDDPLAAVSNASARYAKNAVVYLTLAEVIDGIWEAEWVLALDGETLSWQGQGGIRDLTLEEAVDAVADALASRFATSLPAGSLETVEVVVDGIEQPDDYGALLDYFDGLDAIERVHVELAGGRSLRLVLDVRGGMPEFERLVALGSMLQSVRGSPGRFLVLH